MDTMEYIKDRFDEQDKRMTEHQKRNDEQFTSLEKYLTLKIDSDSCLGCSAAKN